jgi:DNA-binding transcriptional MocR family regulator
MAAEQTGTAAVACYRYRFGGRWRMTRYHRLAEELSARIRSGVLRPGDRMPSVRSVSQAQRVSPATVQQAYHLMEDRGEIHTRPRSGHYVSAHLGGRPLHSPAASQPAAKSSAVDVRDLVFEILTAIKDRDFESFGSAFPSGELFPLGKLARTLHSAAARLDPHSIYEQIPPGNPDLRRMIARRYLESGVDVPIDGIVITNGALEALNLCLGAITRPGDAVAIESPAFYGALEAIERLRLKAVEIQTDPRRGMSVRALAEALERHPIKACWLMTNFQNPLGSLMPDENKKDLVALLAKHAVPMIEDDVYGELYFGDKRPQPAKAFDRAGLVLHCSSFSKCLAPGYRVGWTLPGRFLKEVGRAKLMSTIATSAPSQVAVAEFLRQTGYSHHLRKLRRTLESQQSRMLQAIGRHFPMETKVTRPEGGYFLWVELPGSVSAMEVYRRAFEQKITVSPGPMFSPRRGFENCLRLNYGVAWSPKTDAALATIGGIACALA